MPRARRIHVGSTGRFHFEVWNYPEIVEVLTAIITTVAPGSGSRLILLVELSTHSTTRPRGNHVLGDAEIQAVIERVSGRGAGHAGPSH